MISVVGVFPRLDLDTFQTLKAFHKNHPNGVWGERAPDAAPSLRGKQAYGLGELERKVTNLKIPSNRVKTNFSGLLSLSRSQPYQATYVLDQQNSIPTVSIGQIFATFASFHFLMNLSHLPRLTAFSCRRP